jgi:hypothetical protein
MNTQTCGGAFEVPLAQSIKLTIGGGVNFGIVTEFTYQAYPHPQSVYSGMLIYTPDHIEALVKTYNEWSKTADGLNPKTTFFIATVQAPPMFTPALAALPFYDGDEVEGRRIFKPFFDINPVADLTNSHPYVAQVTPPPSH